MGESTGNVMRRHSTCGSMSDVLCLLCLFFVSWLVCPGLGFSLALLCRGSLLAVLLALPRFVVVRSFVSSGPDGGDCPAVIGLVAGLRGYRSLCRRFLELLPLFGIGLARDCFGSDSSFLGKRGLGC